ncbi:helix-turn-helix domain-containing protein [Streptococcus pasteurianus]|uniref:helix-turn-helix domain-containing protein n=1 Tax=Streptococcus pasteurianus TaxID=197614 RepID=UPI0020BE0BBA|nr:helix-turn-helix transcriptional regulator [Streptococcus pasteurianus]WCQ69471.1 helix-turn-helix transcriptional regulator [Streptococcus pasteurianus]
MYRRIRYLREDRDLKQEYLAEYLACSQSAYSKIEAGKQQLSLDHLIKLSNFYNVSTDYLLGLTDYPKRVMHNKK